jgi:hypothetical protein
MPAFLRTARVAVALLVGAALGTPWAAAQVQSGVLVRVTTLVPGQPAPDQPGERTDVVVGTLLIDAADSIVVLRPGDSIRIARDDIRKLEVAKGSTRPRNALIGAAIGAGVGLLWLAINYGSGCHCELDLCRCISGDAYLGITVLAAPIGAVVGFATGGTKWLEVAQTPVALSARPARRGVRLEVTVTF